MAYKFNQNERLLCSHTDCNMVVNNLSELETTDVKCKNNKCIIHNKA